MDFEFIRFRIDPEIHEKAAKVCERLGIELNDALRTLVTRIARDGALPFEIGASPLPPAREHIPFHDYDPRLWAPLKPQVDAEVALSLLARFVADCSTRIDEEQARGAADSALVKQLRQERADALRARETLACDDTQAVAGVLHKYGPLVRTSSG